MHAIKARQWRVPEPLSTNERVHMNIVPQPSSSTDQVFHLMYYEVAQRLQVHLHAVARGPCMGVVVSAGGGFCSQVGFPSAY